MHTSIHVLAHVHSHTHIHKHNTHTTTLSHPLNTITPHNIYPNTNSPKHTWTNHCKSLYLKHNRNSHRKTWLTRSLLSRRYTSFSSWVNSSLHWNHTAEVRTSGFYAHHTITYVESTLQSLLYYPHRLSTINNLSI